MTILPEPLEHLTPELLRLMEHEKVIEQGLGTFMDVGHALLAIRDSREYIAAGYTTFPKYVKGRWGWGSSRAYQLMDGTAVAELISTNVEIDIPLPYSEGQVRPLTKHKDQPELVREVWATAVELAGGGQPTAAVVTAAMKAKAIDVSSTERQPPKKDHPAPFSDPILDTMAAHLIETGQGGLVLDPFAGIGRVHELRERAGVQTMGVEIEPEWAAKHPDTIEGNALELVWGVDEYGDENVPGLVGQGSIDAIATSPTYGNRMADHHDAKDDSVRLTYKHSLGRDLHDDNSGTMQWGDEYRHFHEVAWCQAVRALKPGGTLTLNIKNHIRAGQQQRVTEWHLDTLYGLGMHLVALDFVPGKGLMAGENHEARVLAEYVMTFRKVES